jgi:hypothetical protein
MVMETDKYINFLTQGYDFASARNWQDLGNFYLQNGMWWTEFTQRFTKFVNTLCRATWISRMDDLFMVVYFDKWRWDKAWVYSYSKMLIRCWLSWTICYNYPFDTTCYSTSWLFIKVNNGDNQKILNKSYSPLEAVLKPRFNTVWIKGKQPLPEILLRSQHEQWNRLNSLSRFTGAERSGMNYVLI